MTRNDQDTSEVYDSFRVGWRAKVTSVSAQDASVTASMTARTLPRCTRRVALEEGALRIDDASLSGTKSRLHLAPGVAVESVDGDRVALLRTPRGRVRVEADHPLVTEEGRASREFGLIQPTTILVQTLVARGDGEARAGWKIARV